MCMPLPLEATSELLLLGSHRLPDLSKMDPSSVLLQPLHSLLLALRLFLCNLS